MNPVTDSTFEADVLKSPKPVIVDFWAPWCGPCRMVSPVLEQIGEEHASEVKVVKVNVDENPEVARRYSVMSIPMITMFKGGEPVAQVIGARTKSYILKEVEEHWQDQEAPSR